MGKTAAVQVVADQLHRAQPALSSLQHGEHLCRDRAPCRNHCHLPQHSQFLASLPEACPALSIVEHDSQPVGAGRHAERNRHPEVVGDSFAGSPAVGRQCAASRFAVVLGHHLVAAVQQLQTHFVASIQRLLCPPPEPYQGSAAWLDLL